MSESDDQYTGVSSRGTKHNPRLDQELEHEIQGMLKAERATRANEWREAEPVAEGDPDIDRDPSGTMTGGVPVGMDRDAVVARAELARWLDRADYPSSGPDLVRAAQEHHAHDSVVDELRRLPEGQTFERIGDVVRALGYPTET